MRSLYTAWTGMATHQRCLDNIGNNLANANTTGFKRNEFQFTNLFNQMISGSMGGGTTHSSTTGIHQGAGVTTGAISPTFKNGSMDPTGRNLDVAINGAGFFLVNTYAGQALTRDGSFYLDHTESANQRMLCSGDGYPVQGWVRENGVITPSPQVGNIYLPAEGDMLPGQVTTTAAIDGILPTNTTGADFTGVSTRNLDLKGNLAANGSNTIRTSIYAPVTQSESGSGVVNNEVQEIPVQINITGPTMSPDGTLSVYNWTMTTVDWPRAGDPAVQIYPPAGNSSFEAGQIRFYASDDASRNRAAGQPAEPLDIKPGSSTVNSVIDLGNGETLETSFTVSSGFELDISRLTNLQNAPGGNALETWYVDGNPAGSMARTVTVFDEVTRFVSVANADGTTSMQAERRVEARQNNLQFAKTETTNTNSVWSWKSSLDGASGTLTFNTIGDLVGSTSSGGGVSYDFTGLQSVNASASVIVPTQNGFVDGFLQDLTIDQYGRIFGHYSNNVAEPLAQLAMATVPNLNGLHGSSGTLFYTSASSGEIMIGVAGDEDGAMANGLVPIGAGSLTSQHLEGSNVDMAVEFTQLITTERGYQANARVITTTDEMLQQLIQMKR